MDGWMDGWMDVCMYVCMHVCINLYVAPTPIVDIAFAPLDCVQQASPTSTVQERSTSERLRLGLGNWICEVCNHSKKDCCRDLSAIVKLAWKLTDWQGLSTDPW